MVCFDTEDTERASRDTEGTEDTKTPHINTQSTDNYLKIKKKNCTQPVNLAISRTGLSKLCDARSALCALCDKKTFPNNMKTTESEPNYITENALTEQIIGAAIEVHKILGPGLLESAYQRALAYELQLRNIPFVEQKLCPIDYKGLKIEDAYRLDFLVNDKVVVELKAVDALHDVHEAQVLTYLKFTGTHIGLLFNFRSMILTRTGLRRLAL